MVGLDATPPDTTPQQPSTGADAREGARERILEEFRAWLYGIDDVALDQAGEPAAESTPDLYTFYAELCALRRDAQLQAKANQALHQGLNELADSLKGDTAEQLQTLRDVTADVRRQIPQARRDAQNSFALELVSLCEAIGRCRHMQRAPQLPSLLWGKRRERVAEALLAPLALLADKAEDSLQRLGIRPIATPGDLFDARTMRAVQTTQAANGNEGRVVNVLRQGYDLNDALMQTAEVEVAEL